MKKNIIITSGPTNERLDAVMKITNMSTGALGATIAKDFIVNKEGDINKIYYLSTKLSRKPIVESSKLEYVTVESTDNLLNALREILTSEKIDAVIHSAAVGDYKGEYSITASMLASQIAEYAHKNRVPLDELKKGILEIIRKPEVVVSDEHKISSYEPDLMFKLALTPKVIGEIKRLSPDTDLFGFKLLDGVSREELIEVASRLRAKNQAKYIIANDLSQIGNGKHPAYFVGENGVDYTCETKDDIARTLRKIIF
ncbi:MAG: hypothetical protein NC483_01035 [Ruminococcus sp.]|nr:hypothetical protein [Ruminococcus sp.]